MTPRRWALGLAAAAAVLIAAVAVAYVVLRDTAVATAIEAQTIAWRFQVRGPLPAPGSVAVVALDDRTIAAAPGWPVRRAVLADAVRRLSAAGARVVALDVLLVGPDPDGGAGDAALRAALSGSDAVLATAFTFDATVPGMAAGDDTLQGTTLGAVVRLQSAVPLLQATSALAPLPALGEVAGLGHVNLLVPDDGLVRQLHAAIGFSGRVVPALPVEAARRRAGLAPGDVTLVLGRELRIGERVVPLDRFNRIALGYYGPERTVPTFSLIDLLEDRIPAAALAGRVVLIGVSALGAGDTFVTPFSRSFPGVEILATATANILDGSAIDAGDDAASWSLLAILLCGAGGFAAALLPVQAVAGLALAALLGAWLAMAQFAFADRLVALNATFPTAALILSAALAATARLARDRRLRRRAERERRNLAGYHSPAIVDLLAQGDVAALDDRAQNAAILFIDIAGSTGRSERAGPVATAAFLRAFHARVEAPVLAQGGVMEQLSGDGAMVMFGVPQPRGDDAARALACAQELARIMAGWSGELAAAGDEPLRIGIGIHYGPVVITRLGGAHTRHVTAAGDTVNVASRIEALTRLHKATIAVSDAAVAAIRAGGSGVTLAAFKELPPQTIRGREQPVTVWIGG